MKETHVCPKCGSRDVVRIPDNGRYANGNNIYLSTVLALRGRVPVIRFVCGRCGYTEEWVERPEDLERLKAAFSKA